MTNEIINYEQDFEALIHIIETTKARTMKTINTELIDMYWQIGKYISEKTASEQWGKSPQKNKKY